MVWQFGEDYLCRRHAECFGDMRDPNVRSSDAREMLGECTTLFVDTEFLLTSIADRAARDKGDALPVTGRYLLAGVRAFLKEAFVTRPRLAVVVFGCRIISHLPIMSLQRQQRADMCPSMRRSHIPIPMDDDEPVCRNLYADETEDELSGRDYVLDVFIQPAQYARLFTKLFTRMLTADIGRPGCIVSTTFPVNRELCCDDGPGSDFYTDPSSGLELYNTYRLELDDSSSSSSASSSSAEPRAPRHKWKPFDQFLRLVSVGEPPVALAILLRALHTGAVASSQRNVVEVIAPATDDTYLTTLLLFRALEAPDRATEVCVWLHDLDWIVSVERLADAIGQARLVAHVYAWLFLMHNDYTGCMGSVQTGDPDNVEGSEREARLLAYIAAFDDAAPLFEGLVKTTRLPNGNTALAIQLTKCKFVATDTFFLPMVVDATGLVYESLADYRKRILDTEEIAPRTAIDPADSSPVHLPLHVPIHVLHQLALHGKVRPARAGRVYANTYEGGEREILAATNARLAKISDEFAVSDEMLDVPYAGDALDPLLSVRAAAAAWYLCYYAGSVVPGPVVLTASDIRQERVRNYARGGVENYDTTTDFQLAELLYAFEIIEDDDHVLCKRKPDDGSGALSGEDAWEEPQGSVTIGMANHVHCTEARGERVHGRLSRACCMSNLGFVLRHASLMTDFGPEHISELYNHLPLNIAREDPGRPGADRDPQTKQDRYIRRVFGVDAVEMQRGDGQPTAWGAQYAGMPGKAADPAIAYLKFMACSMRSMEDALLRPLEFSELAAHTPLEVQPFVAITPSIASSSAPPLVLQLMSDQLPVVDGWCCFVQNRDSSRCIMSTKLLGAVSLSGLAYALAPIALASDIQRPQTVMRYLAQLALLARVERGVYARPVAAECFQISPASVALAGAAIGGDDAADDATGTHTTRAVLVALNSVMSLNIASLNYNTMLIARDWNSVLWNEYMLPICGMWRECFDAAWIAALELKRRRAPDEPHAPPPMSRAEISAVLDSVMTIDTADRGSFLLGFYHHVLWAVLATEDGRGSGVDFKQLADPATAEQCRADLYRATRRMRDRVLALTRDIPLNRSISIKIEPRAVAILYHRAASDRFVAAHYRSVMAVFKTGEVRIMDEKARPRVLLFYREAKRVPE